MGYSIVTVLNSTEYRYTEWVDFNTAATGGKTAPDWSRVVGRELYVHGAASPDGDFSGDLQETVNEFGNELHAAAVLELRVLLRAGPKKGGGWGPHSARARSDVSDIGAVTI